MILRTLPLIAVLFSCLAHAQEGGENAAEIAEKKPFKVADVINPAVAALGAPTMPDGLEPVVLPVMTQSDHAKAMVHNGVALLDAAWDFEAYRYFCEAAKADPDCLMAYWGISVTIGSGLPEFREQWNAATGRMIDLMGARTAGGTFIYSEYERSHAACAALLLTEGADAAAAAYRQMAKKYPNDIQSQVLAALLSIGGYDEFGDPRAQQATAERLVHESFAKNQQNQALLTTYLLVHSVLPDNDERLRDRIIPFGRTLVKSGVPTHQHLLAFLEWKVGNLMDCERWAAAASEGFGKYMAAGDVSIADCEKGMLSDVLHAFALHSRGRTDEALQIAARLRGATLPKGRANSSGGGVYLWDARTLQARLYISRGTKADIAKVREVLPPPGSDELLNNESASVVFIQSLALEAEIRSALADGKIDIATTGHRAYQGLLESFGNLREPARVRGELTEWFRAFTSMRSTFPSLRGLIAREQPEAQQSRAWIWFASAAEQQPAVNLFRAPLILRPYHYEVAREYLRKGNNERAEKFLHEGLQLYPNHLPSMQLLVTTLEALGKDDNAAQVKSNIERLINHE